MIVYTKVVITTLVVSYIITLYAYRVDLRDVDGVKDLFKLLDLVGLMSVIFVPLVFLIIVAMHGLVLIMPEIFI